MSWLQLNRSATKYSKNVTFSYISLQLHMQCHFTMISQPVQLRRKKIHTSEYVELYIYIYIHEYICTIVHILTFSDLKYLILAMLKHTREVGKSY